MTSRKNDRIVCSYSVYSLDVWCLSVEVIRLNISSDLCLPLVSIVQELLLVVQELFMRLRRKLKVRTLKQTQRKNTTAKIADINNRMWQA